MCRCSDTVVGAEKALTALYTPHVAGGRLWGAQPPSSSSSSVQRLRAGTVWCLLGDLSEMSLRLFSLSGTR